MIARCLPQLLWTTSADISIAIRDLSHHTRHVIVQGKRQAKQQQLQLAATVAYEAARGATASPAESAAAETLASLCSNVLQHTGSATSQAVVAASRLDCNSFQYWLTYSCAVSSY